MKSKTTDETKELISLIQDLENLISEFKRLYINEVFEKEVLDDEQRNSSAKSNQ